MKKTLMGVASVALLVGVVGCKDDGRTVGQKVDDAAQKAGQATANAANAATQGVKSVKDDVVSVVTPSGDSDVTGMRGTLEGIVQNAMDPGNFTTMTNHLVNADQKRLEANAPKNEALDNEIKKFKDAWKAKYNGDIFSAMDSGKVYTPEFAALTSEGADNKMKHGKVAIAASHGLPALDVPMVGEDGKWRLDIPDDMTAEKAQANLLKAVQDINGMSAEWPSDINEAYRHVTHRVLMALLDK